MGSASKRPSIQAKEETNCYLDGKPDNSSTINGRPLLSAAAIQQWFVDARLGKPSLKAVFPIAVYINDLDFAKALWSDDPDCREWRNKSPSRLAQQRIASAIATLCDELPGELQHSKMFNPDGYNEIIQLLEIAQLWRPHLEAANHKTLGRNVCNWHNVARKLRGLFKEAITESDLKNCSFTTTTSKGLPLLQAALSHLGVRKSGAQIVEALRSPRTRVHLKGK